MSHLRPPCRSLRPRRHALAAATLSLLLSQALLPPSADAAALGSLRVQSAQGEPLQAEIELRDVAPGEGDGLQLALASPRAYAAAGLTYPAGAEGLRLQLARSADGRYVAQLRSQQPVGDAFIDLLLELRSPTGTASRVYTVLLAAPPADPAVTAALEPGATPLVQAATPEPAASAPAPAMDDAPRSPQANARPATPSAGTAGGSYTVRRGDHLYGIARGLVGKHDAVSLDQMVVALYRANRDAFIAGNMNRLKAGAVLSLPSQQQAGGIAAPEARREVVAHTRAFDAYRNRLADAAAAMQVPPQSGQQQRGQVTARVRDAAVPDQPRDELRLSKPEGGVAAANSGASEAEVARERQLRDAEERLAQLRKNVGDMQRLLEMKSAELAQLGQGGPTQGASAPAGAAAPVPATAGAQPGGAAPARPAVTSAASAAAAPAVAPLQASTSWFDALLASPWTLPGGGLAIALLGGYALYRRQRQPGPAMAGTEAGSADVLADAPVALTGLSLPLDAFPAPAGGLPVTAPPAAIQAFMDTTVEAEAGDDGEAAPTRRAEGAGPAAPAPRPLAFDLGGISLDLDAGDGAGKAGGSPAKDSPDIMAPPAVHPDTNSDTNLDTNRDTNRNTPPRS